MRAKRISVLPRWMHRAYANAFNYFWLPCPICGRSFGGHEWKTSKALSSIYTSAGGGEGVCPACTGSAAVAENHRQWKPIESEA